MTRAVVILMFTTMAACGLARQAGAQFTSAFDRTPDRPWVGPEYWANPLQDWRIAGGALACVRPGPSRSLMLLTRELSDRPAPFSSSITIAHWQPPTDKRSSAWVGFRIAARGRFGDCRDDALYGKGIEAGLRAGGRLFVGDVSNAGAAAPGRRPADAEAGQRRVHDAGGPGERGPADADQPPAGPGGPGAGPARHRRVLHRTRVGRRQLRDRRGPQVEVGAGRAAARGADRERVGAKPYPGWPITIRQPAPDAPGR